MTQAEALARSRPQDPEPAPSPGAGEVRAAGEAFGRGESKPGRAGFSPAEEHRARILVKFTVLGGAALAVFGALNLLRGNRLAGVAEIFATLVLCPLVIHLLVRRRNLRLSVTVFMFYILTLFPFLFYSGGLAGTGVLWLFFYPIVCFFFLGSRRGLLFFGLFLAVLLLIAFASPALGHRLPYGAMFTVVFFSSLALESAFMFSYERSRERTEEAVRQYIEEVQRLNGRLRHLSTHDALTRVANRRRIMGAIRAELRRLARHGQPFSVLLLDIDHFKSVNDVHGHAFGDVVLRQFASLLKGECRRSTDRLGRYGGEEFLVLLPHTGEDGARALAERTLHAVRAARFGPLETIRLTASVGVHTVVRREKLRAVLERADGALYRAKRSGRDRCVGSADGA